LIISFDQTQTKFHAKDKIPFKQMQNLVQPDSNSHSNLFKFSFKHIIFSFERIQFPLLRS